MNKMVAEDVCVIVLNWKNWSDTIRCLESLRDLSPSPQTVIVCDNGSPDDSQQRIVAWARSNFNSNEVLLFPSLDAASKIRLADSSRCPRFIYFQCRNNLGYAGGNNVGLQWALSQSYDYLWLLNNDTTVNPRALSALLDCAARDLSVGIWGSTVCWMDKPEIVQCAGGCIYSPSTSMFKAALEGHRVSEVCSSTRECPLDYIFGASFFVRSEVFARVGLLSEDYFLFCEELDFCIRARKKGYSLGWCRESIIYHKGSATIGAYGDTNAQAMAQANYHENLSALILTKKFYPRLLSIVMLFRFCGKIIISCKRRHFFLLRPLLRAYRDFLVRSFRVDKR